MKNEIQNLINSYNIKIKICRSELKKLNKNLKQCSTDIDKHQIRNLIDHFTTKKETLKNVVKGLNSVIKNEKETK